MLNLSIIEQAIKAEMAAQIQSKKWAWIREIKTYGGELDDDLEAVVKMFPAIWITFDGSKSPEKLSYNKTRLPITFVVMVGARSVRNEEAQRHGAGRDIGTYQMLDNVQRLLAENDLSSQGISGLAPLELGRVKTIFNHKVRTQSLSVLAQEFHTSYTVIASDRDRERESEDTPDMHSINLDYYFQPQDDIKDASDLVQLDQH
uniref:phage protein Gp37 n=1 Tax=uncultured Acinetobacter sp. TaxID=165433 RepID=UPI00263871C8|nr:phage protein Gp37 [uncultured Acinetobacter sp.]